MGHSGCHHSLKTKCCWCCTGPLWTLHSPLPPPPPPVPPPTPDWIGTWRHHICLFIVGSSGLSESFCTSSDTKKDCILVSSFRALPVIYYWKLYHIYGAAEYFLKFLSKPFFFFFYVWDACAACSCCMCMCVCVRARACVRVFACVSVKERHRDRDSGGGGGG